MPNKIQIRRTTVTGRTPNTTEPTNTQYIDTGELALNLTDGKMFSSNGTVYFEVGANLNSAAIGGTFTANSTLVNASALNVVNRTNTATLYVTTSANVGTALTVNSTSVNVGANVDIDSGTLTVDTVLNRVGVNTAIGSIGGAALYVTSSPGATSAIEVLAGSHFMKILPNMNAGNYNGLTAAGDTGLIFSNNTQGFGNLLIGSWSAASFGIKFNSSANSITIAGNTVNISTSLSIGSATVNSALANLQALNVVNQTNTGTLFVTTSANVGTAFTANSTLVNAIALNVVNQTNTATLYVTTSANVASAFLANSTGAYHTGTMNAASHTVGTTTVVNSTAIALGPFGTTNGALITTTTFDLGNTTANAAVDYNIIYVANSSSRANLTPTTLAIGSITVNSALANLQALNVVNQTNTATLYVTTSANVGTAFTTNSTLTNTVALNVVNTINVGSLGVTNGVNITNTYIAIGNTTVNGNILPYGLLVNRVANATANAFIAMTTNSLEYGAIELGGSLGGFIDFKAPNSDDYDYRLISSDAGFYIYGGSSTASANAIFIQNANVSIDSGVFFVDWVNNRVGINNTAPAVEFRVTGSSDVSGTMNAASHTVGTAFTANATLVNAAALNVVNQTNTATLYVTTSANVASAFLANSTGAYHTGTMNAASHTVGTNFTSNSSQMILNAPSYTVSFSNTNGSATNYITWSTSGQQAVPSVTTRSIGTKIIFYDGLSGASTDWAYGLAGSEMWASVGTTTGTFRWYAVTTAFMTSNTTFFNHNAQVRVGGGVGTTNGTTITNTSIAVGNSTINTSANSTAILVNGTDLVATQKRSIAMSLVFGR